LPSTSGLCGRSVVISSNPRPMTDRRPGEVGLTFLTDTFFPLAYSSKYSMPFEPSWRLTKAFFQLEE